MQYSVTPSHRGFDLFVWLMIFVLLTFYDRLFHGLRWLSIRRILLKVKEIIGVLDLDSCLPYDMIVGQYVCLSLVQSPV